MTPDAIHAEGKRRFLLTHPMTAPEAFDAWLAFALQRGGTIVLQLDGCRAEFEVPPITQQATAPSGRKPARAKASHATESRFTPSDDLAAVQASESAPQGSVGAAR
jgi:hypothetical protein